MPLGGNNRPEGPDMDPKADDGGSVQPPFRLKRDEVRLQAQLLYDQHQQQQLQQLQQQPPPQQPPPQQ